MNPNTTFDSALGDPSLMPELLNVADVVLSLIRRAWNYQLDERRLAPGRNACQEELTPASIVRALLIGQQRLDATIKLAIRHFLEAKEDLQRFEQVAAHLRLSATDNSDYEDAAADLLNRGRRRLNHTQRTLDDLCVTVREISVETPLELDVHSVVEFQPTMLPQLDGCVASVRRDLFTWRDEWGQPQLQPAEVVAFVFKGTTAPTRAGTSAVVGTSETDACTEDHSLSVEDPPSQQET